ncbi:MAG: SH3 domain-containing protein [Nodosilinea sp.]
MNWSSRLLLLSLSALIGLGGVGCGGGKQREATSQTDVLPDEVKPVPAPQPSSEPAPITPAPAQPVSPSATSEPNGLGTVLNPPKPAQLMSSEPGSRINLRSGPSTSTAAKGYGFMGDPVQLLRSTQGSEGLWYYVKFEKSGAEGWICSDFVNLTGRGQPVASRAAQGSQCQGRMEALTFTVFYDANGFNLVRFQNMETKNTFDSPLARQGSNNQGQPLYTGTASPPAGGSYPVQLTDLSGGKPGGGSQVSINYSGMLGNATCP